MEDHEIHAIDHREICLCRLVEEVLYVMRLKIPQLYQVWVVKRKTLFLFIVFIFIVLRNFNTWMYEYITVYMVKGRLKYMYIYFYHTKYVTLGMALNIVTVSIKVHSILLTYFTILLCPYPDTIQASKQ